MRELFGEILFSLAKDNTGPVDTGCPPGYHERPVFGFGQDAGALADETPPLTECVPDCDPACVVGRECCVQSTIQIPNQEGYACSVCDEGDPSKYYYCCEPGVKPIDFQLNGNDPDNQNGFCYTCDPGWVGRTGMRDGVRSCFCEGCDCSVGFAALPDDCKMVCCRDKKEETPGCPQCPDGILNADGTPKEPAEICEAPRVYSEDCKDCSCPGQGQTLQCEGTAAPACMDPCQAPKTIQFRDGTCVCECPNGKEFFDCGDAEGPLTGKCHDPCIEGKKFAKYVVNGSERCGCVNCEDRNQVTCGPQVCDNCGNPNNKCLPACVRGEDYRLKDCSCCDEQTKTIWEVNNEKTCVDKCGDQNTEGRSKQAVQVGGVEVPANQCFKCDDANPIMLACYGECTICDWNKRLKQDCTCEECPACMKRDGSGNGRGNCRFYTGPDPGVPADLADCPGVFLGTMGIVKKDGECTCVCSNGGKYIKDEQRCEDATPGPEQGPFPPDPGGGGPGGGGPGGGGGSSSGSSTNPCGANATLDSDGNCYCNYPASWYDASTGRCACSSNYVFGDDGSTCVPQWSNSGGYDGIGATFMPKTEIPPITNSICDDVVCPPNQCCHETVFGFDCRVC